MNPRRPIAILSPDVAEQIAAGEVVERPTSVVRELIDNAIDAGATDVTIELRGGGLELIRVNDDGCGIPPDEVELAFRHHATSKIGSFGDLLTLRTLGFRGEALPSIAAVSEVEMLTRDAAHDSGTRIVLRAGEVIRRRRAARQPGTTVTVRRLFHNVPARLKFVSAGRGESLQVGHLVRRYALAHPSVRLSLALDGRLSFRSSGSGRLDLTIAEVYGSAVGNTLLCLPRKQVDGTAVSGFLSVRSITRPRRDHLTLIVNGRLAASRGLATALESAYRPVLPRGRHPIAVVVVEVPPAELDPNIHPAKTEVRLAREPVVAAALADVIRAALAHAPALPNADADFSVGSGQYRLPFRQRRIAEGSGPTWQRALRDELSGSSLPALRILGQVQDSLILAEGEHGLFLIDQHRADERIIYEDLLRRGGADATGAQTLLEPVVVELKPHQAILLDERLSDLEGLGLSCQRIGGRDYLVRAVPAVPGRENVATNLDVLLEEAASEDEGWRERLMASLACRAAVRRNRPLSESEMKDLLRGLAATTAPAVCPHGSPLILHLSDGFLKKQFDW